MRLSSIVFFDDKVSSVRDATAGAPAPQFTAAPIGCELRFFRPVTPADVIKVVQELPDKQCYRSSADMASESQCQSSVAISVSAFQLVTATRYRSVEYEVRLCHTDTLKSRLGLLRREIV